MNSAQYECEGHTVVFLVNENDTVRVSQLYEAQQNVSSHAENPFSCLLAISNVEFN